MSPTQLLRWDADVTAFLARLERALRDFRTSMGSSEFKALVFDYRELSPTEKRAVANHLQARGLGALLRALHAGDYRMYTESWEPRKAAPGTDER